MADGKAKRRMPKGMIAPWRPGQSGNPGGRPKSDGRLWRAVLDSPVPANLLKRLNRGRHALKLATGSTFGDVIMCRMAWKAALGDIDAAKLVFNRGFGAPLKNANLTVEGSVDIEVSAAKLKDRLEAFLSGRNSEDGSRNALPEPEHEVIDLQPVPEAELTEVKNE